MASATQIRDKVKAILTRFQATSRIVKFRQVTVTGGNTLLGIGGTRTVTDTLCTPQPVVEAISSEEIAGSGGLLLPGDYRMLFDGTVPETTLRNRQILYGDEVLDIAHVIPVPLGGISVAWQVICRTVKTRT